MGLCKSFCQCISLPDPWTTNSHLLNSGRLPGSRSKAGANFLFISPRLHIHFLWVKRPIGQRLSSSCPKMNADQASTAMGRRPGPKSRVHVWLWLMNWGKFFILRRFIFLIFRKNVFNQVSYIRPPLGQKGYNFILLKMTVWVILLWFLKQLTKVIYTL